MEKFVINLKRRPDRLTQVNLPFEFIVFEATDGKEVFLDAPIKNKGFLGCLDSYRRLFKLAKDKNLESIMIFEDDIEVPNDFNFKLEKIILELPEDWDLLYLGGWNVGDKIKYSESLDVAKRVYTTHGFIVRSKFYDTILESINSRDWKVDVLIADTLPNGNCFICNPTIAWQKEGFSDIENKITNNTHLK